MRFRKVFPIRIALATSPFAGMLAAFALHIRAEDRKFRPIMEAEMPAGFPKYTPVGEVQIKI